MLDKQMMDQLEQVSNLDADEFYRNVAATQQAARGGFNWEVAATIAAGAVGYSVAALPGAIAAALVGAAWVGWKLTDSWDALNEIESGDFVKWLPERERRLYQQEAIALIDAPNVSSEQTTPSGISSQDIVSIIAGYKPVRSMFFCGASRTCKSIIASQAATQLKSSLGDRCSLWVFSAKVDLKESGYWVAADRLAFHDFLNGSPDDKEAAFESWFEGLQEFKQLDSPVNLLLVDELSLIGGIAVKSPKDSWAARFWREFTEFMLALSSAGASSNKAVWVISPTGQVGGLGLDRTVIGAFHPVFTAQLKNASPGWNQTVYIGAKGNGLAPKSEPTQEEFRAASEHNAGLIVGMNGGWHPCQQYIPPQPSDEVSRAIAPETFQKHETLAKLAETLQDKPFHEFPKLSETETSGEKDPLEGVDPEIVKQVKKFHEQGLKQVEVIRSVWGISPGGSEKYQEAVRIYREIVK